MNKGNGHGVKDGLSILHIILAVRETSAPYNEHCLPWAEQRDVALCTYFPSDITPPATISLFEGNGTVTGFFRALKAALDAKQYDVIHAHSPHVGILFLARTLLTNRQAVFSSVITVHDSYPNFKVRNRLMFLPVFARFRRVICCGRASRDSFPRYFKALAGKRLDFVPNGLDIARVDRITARTVQAKIDTRDFTVIAISRLVDIKNPFTALAALQQCADQTTKMIYIGDGPLRGDLLERSRAGEPRPRIEFTGLIPREKVFEHLLRADLFVSTSRGEGLPVAVLEAMACGRPVLLSDIPPHREIAEGVDFIPLVPCEDAAGFARELRKFREMPLSMRTHIGQQCRKLVERRFSLHAMHAGYEAVYGQIINRPRPALSEALP